MGPGSLLRAGCILRGPGAGDTVESIGAVAGHFGMGFDPAVLYLIAYRLRRPEGEWRPVGISGLRQLVFHWFVSRPVRRQQHAGQQCAGQR